MLSKNERITQAADVHFQKSSKPTSIHNSSLLSRNIRNAKSDAFLVMLPMATPSSKNVSIVLMRTVCLCNH